MKRIFLVVLFSFIALSAFAQWDFPAGMRMEVAEAGQDDNEYSIFAYRDDDGTFGYYLSLGHVFHLLEIFREDITDASLDHLDEACLWLGATADEAFATLDSFLELLDADMGTAVEFPGRLSSGAEKLGEPSTATCVVVKRLLQGKRLCFYFTSGRHTAQADLTKSAVKSLKSMFKLDQKIHPNRY